MLTLLGIIYEVHRWLNPCRLGSCLQSLGWFHQWNKWAFMLYFIMIITFSFLKFITPFSHILPVRNVFTINRNEFEMSFSSSSLFTCRKVITARTSHLAGLWHEYFELTVQAQCYCCSGLFSCAPSCRH